MTRLRKPGFLAALTERARRRVIRWFRRQGFLDAAAAAGMLAWENSGCSIDASVRITLIDRDVLPRHKVANWVGPGRGRPAWGRRSCHERLL